MDNSAQYPLYDSFGIRLPVDIRRTFIPSDGRDGLIGRYVDEYVWVSTENVQGEKL
jgi:hypothetical protein